MKGSDTGRGGRWRISLNEDPMGGSFTMAASIQFVSRAGHLGRQFAIDHYVQVMIRVQQKEYGEHLIKHLGVLDGDASSNLDIWALLEGLADRNHLDHLGRVPISTTTFFLGTQGP